VTLDEAILGFILFCLWPLWMVAGVVDYFCHRATHIELNSGVKECILHIVMGFQVGVPVFVALVFKINVLVMLICLAMLVAHELVAVWDMRMAAPVRRISLVETHAHAYLLSMPFYTFGLVALLNWEAFTRTLSFEWSEPFALVLRDKPLGPEGYLGFHFALVFCLGLLPYGEELYRCMKARKRASGSV
jgi:hypothetical protein